MGNEFDDLCGARRSDLRRHVARRARLAGRVQPDPFPPHRLGQGPVQDDVDPVDGPRRQGAPFTTTPTAEVGVEPVAVRGRELCERQVAEVGLQVVLDEALRLAHRARRPVPRCRLEPAIEQLGHTSGMDPA